MASERGESGNGSQGTSAPETSAPESGTLAGGDTGAAKASPEPGDFSEATPDAGKNLDVEKSEAAFCASDNASLAAREGSVLNRMDNRQQVFDGAPVASQVEAGQTGKMSLDDFRERKDFASIGDKEPCSWHLSHAGENPSEWMAGSRGQQRASAESNWEYTESHRGPEGVTSAQDVIDKGWVQGDNHFGLEVDVPANTAQEADDKVREALGETGFTNEFRPGFDQGCNDKRLEGNQNQYWRDDDEKQYQEHLRYYGVVEDSQHPGHYRAIFVCEKHSAGNH